MKKLLFSLLLLSFVNVFGQNLKCKKFKNGRFEMPKDSIVPGFTLIRKGNIQTEIMHGQNDSLKFIVKWIDKCTYTLTPSKKALQYLKLPKSAVLKVEIIETKKDSYIQKSTSNFADFEFISEIFKIK